MRGYPKIVATKQDFLNLLSMEEFKEAALEDLKRLSAIKDDKVLQVLSGSEEAKDLVIKEISAPRPQWKQKGFSSRKELEDLIAAKEGN